ncbi:MAG TPA: PIN domain-containing protein [Gammaproteobacteria bacterium]|nr:PIN domain-containing protein [Gammaproteobacteria bacterium]
MDTSCWVHQIRRRGDVAVRARVEALLAAGTAAWCPQIRLELWAGARSDHDRKLLRDYEKVLPDLAITEAVWRLACDLGDRARRAGIGPRAGHLLIAACARVHSVEIEHADSDFDRLAMLH